ncbi:MAG: zinc ribbon domain-containing protein [Turicibacter sp.]|nr:zinc ribbon domain-containing protein [Turicibacter sp.]
MSNLLTQEQRDQIRRIYEELTPTGGLATTRIFVSNSDRQAVRFNKRITSFGIQVFGDEVVLFTDTSKRGNGKDGFSLTNDHFHTSIGIDPADGKPDKIYRIPYAGLIGWRFEGDHAPLSVGTLIMEVDGESSVALGKSQIEFHVTKALSDMLIRVIEVIQAGLPKVEPVVFRCSGCGANVTTTDKFCEYCGSSVQAPEPEPDEQESHTQETTEINLGGSLDSLFGSINHMMSQNGLDPINFGDVQTDGSQTVTTITTNENGKTVTKTMTTKN